MRIELVGADKLLARIEGITPRMLLRVSKAVRKVTLMVEARTLQKLSGQVLKVRTGRLRRSINSKITDSPTGSAGTVGTNVSYARIHEFGGTTRAHLIQAKNKRALSFAMGGHNIVRKSVMHPGSHIPERSFLRSSLRELLPQLRNELKAG